MLQKTANDGAHPDVVGHARHLRWQHAGTAHNQINLYAALPGPDQRQHQVFVRQRVHLGDQACVLALAGSFTQRVDFFDQLALQMKRRQQNMIEFWQPALAGQMHKNIVNVDRQQRLGSEVADVRVQARRFGVVVAG